MTAPTSEPVDTPANPAPVEPTPFDEVEPVELAPLGDMHPMMRLAASGASIEHVREAYALYREMRADKAREAFEEAFARFQQQRPRIPKSREARRTNDPGAAVLYRYADLDTIAEALKESLHANGLSYSWSSPQADEKGLTLCCRIAHKAGHIREHPYTTPWIKGTALMNEAQARAATHTYAMRYSLIEALGLTACDDDTDGRTPEPEPRITEQQAADLETFAENVGADKAKFLAFLGVASFAEIPASAHGRAVAALEKKRKAHA